ncbi:hypothetical protein LMIY3S_04139 [Labrys miyagiensis]
MTLPGTAGILPALGNAAFVGAEDAGRMPAIPESRRSRHPILPPPTFR